MRIRRTRRRRLAALATSVAMLTAGCSGSTGSTGGTTTRAPAGSTGGTTTRAPAGKAETTTTRASRSKPRPARIDTVAGMPAVPDPTNLYSEAGAADLAPTVAGDLDRVYVPNSKSGTVTVIDRVARKPIATFQAGSTPQHIVPSYDLRTLWELNNSGDTLIPIDPKTGQPGPPVLVVDPYNLYFTPDGRDAVVVAERERRLDFRDPHTMVVRSSLVLPCQGINHIDFAIDGRYLIATCEFEGAIVKVDMVRRKLVGKLMLGDHGAMSMPQDVRISPDGRSFYVADMIAGGVWVIDGASLRKTTFIPTGVGTHGLYPSRDGRQLYVANRGWRTLAAGRHGPGSVSVIDFATRKVVANWPVPGGGSPDMGNLSADGNELWLAGRYDAEVYVFDTRTGVLTSRIPVGEGPHGLTVWPQPGRYSLGHTGNMR
ncbi:MAG: hypothetical protein ACR2MB_09450 [Acidimicrobiales bacterium]